MKSLIGICASGPPLMPALGIFVISQTGPVRVAARLLRKDDV